MRRQKRKRKTRAQKKLALARRAQGMLDRFNPLPFPKRSLQQAYGHSIPVSPAIARYNAQVEAYRAKMEIWRAQVELEAYKLAGTIELYAGKPPATADAPVGPPLCTIKTGVLNA